MEQEHMIIIALLVVALYFLMNRKSCDCAKPCQGFNIEKFSADERALQGGNPNAWIRKRAGDYDFISNDPTFNKRVQSRNHNMYHSQYVKHHLKADHRGKMMRNMMGESDDPANSAGTSARP